MEPNFEVKGSTGMARRVEKTKSNTAIDTATEQHSDPEALMRHAAGQVRLKIDFGGL